jgi:ATP-dependent DNA helicase RecG
MRAACNEFGQRQVHAGQNRNRRIGEFLKELDLTEGRSTGIPKILKVMAANGSPAPLFETNDERAPFVVRLPAHPLAKQRTANVAMDVTTDVTVEVAALLQVIQRDMPIPALQVAIGSGMQSISTKHT